MSAHSRLKTGTAAAHSDLDAALSHFDFSDQSSYAAFLQVHARVLPAIEEALRRIPDIPHWRPRTQILMHDLAEMHCRPENPMTISENIGQAEAFGLFYVIEGSRLGGQFLLRRVGAGMPSKFLSAVHMPGEWRGILAELNRQAEEGGDPWLEHALSGAALGFQLYADAAREIGQAA